MPPRRQSVRSNRICFTLNNYTEEECSGLVNRLNLLSDHISYAVIGKERGAAGTPHLQGFVHLKTSFLKSRDGNVTRWKSLFLGLARAHLESAYGTDQQSKDYCTKERDILIEMGDANASTASKWELLLQVTSIEEASKICPETTVRCYNQLAKIAESNYTTQELPKTVTTLRQWQKDVYQRYLLQSERSILFVQDRRGNSGKSKLARFVYEQHPGETLVLRQGTATDQLYTFSRNRKNKYIIFDYARNKSPDCYAWDVMEAIKDGMVTSSKYESTSYCIPHRCHVIVFTNHDLSAYRDKLSYDRWQIVDLDSYRQLCGPEFDTLLPIQEPNPLPPTEVSVEEEVQQNDLIDFDDDFINQLLNDNF